MKWSGNQLKAIEGRGSDIIVSAAAGSGKTAVLIQRLKSLVTDDGVSLDEVLVATFTNAAAAELKERLAEALTQEIEDAQDDEQREFLLVQRKNIETASIGTFHSFAIDLLREFNYRAGISKNFGILSQQSDALITREALDAVFTEFFEAKDESFLAFLDAYSNDKSDDDIKKNIIDVYIKLRALPYYDAILDREVEVFKRATLDFNSLLSLHEYRELIKKMFSDEKKYFDLLLGMLDDAGCVSLKEKVQKLSPHVYEPNIDFMTADIEDIRRYVKTVLEDFPRMAVSKDEKESYEEVKEECQKIARKFKAIIKDDLLESILTVPLEREPELMKETGAHLTTFSKIIKAVDRISFELKRKRNAYSFSDLEHLALKVLCMDDVAAIYRDRIKHIFVDEYQDSNEMQEEILHKFAKDNLFLVGDVKQSIYRFRFAEPSLFEGRYEAYLGTSSSGSIVDLKENYRSKQAVIDAVNALFKDVIPKYDERHKLVAGRKDNDFIGEVKVCEAEFNKEITNDDELKSKEEYKKYLKLIDTLGRDFYEGLLIGSEIKVAIGREYFDAKEGVQKKLKFSDIAVLFRSIKGRGKKIKLALELLGIPTNMQASGDILDFKEVNLLHCILKLAANFYDDLSLVTVLLSPVYGFTPQDIAEIRIWGDENGYKAQPFYACFLAFSKNLCRDDDAGENGETNGNGDALKNEDCELFVKARDFVNDILRFRSYGYALSLHVFIKRVCTETGIYEFAEALKQSRNPCGNIERYIDFAHEFERERGIATLSDLLLYIEDLYKNELAIEQEEREGENTNAVSIMTIHRSKGLEFPMVVVAGCGRNFVKTKSASYIEFDKNHGMFMRYMGADELVGIPHREILHKYAEKDAEYDEAMRIFYVACTRAKDFLVFSAVTDGKKGSIITYNSFYDVINDTLVCNEEINKEKWFEYEEFDAASLLNRIINSKYVRVKGQEVEGKKLYLAEIPEVKNELKFSGGLSSTKEFVSVTEFLKITDREAFMNSSTNVKAGIDENNNVQNSNTLFFDKKDGFSYFAGNEKNENDSLRINGENFRDMHVDKSQNDEPDPASIGTAVHKLFERLSFEKMACAGEDEMTAMVLNELGCIKNEFSLSDDEQRYIENKKIHEVVTFFKDEFMQNIIRKAKSIEKEKPFMMRDDKLKGRIIEGVIDCFIESDDEIIVIDYKTNNIYGSYNNGENSEATDKNLESSTEDFSIDNGCGSCASGKEKNTHRISETHEDKMAFGMRRIKKLIEYYGPQLKLYKRACELGYDIPVFAYIYFTNAKMFCEIK